MSNNILSYRYIARITVEADTPIKVGTGKAGLLTDEVVATDAYGFPYIPGTTLAGVLRNSLIGHLKIKVNDKEVNAIDKIFGHNKKCLDSKGKEYYGEGSRLIVSSASMIGYNGDAIESVVHVNSISDSNKKEFYKAFENLPIRDHVKIYHTGSIHKEDLGKFDEQVVYKGTRFVFELELTGNAGDKTNWQTLLNTVSSPEFRIGGGTRKGFGKLKVVSDFSKTRIFNLIDDDDLTAYLEKEASLSSDFGGKQLDVSDKVANHTHYQLKIKPEDFFSFTSGNPSGEKDSVAKTEKVINWTNGKPKFSEEKILIPATSVKGAIAHRVAFHYNKLTDKFADYCKSPDELEALTGDKNPAVAILFGRKADSKNDKDQGQRGRVIFSDVFKDKTGDKLLNHVSIDRFTGGAIEGALFNEEVVKTDKFTFDIIVEDMAKAVEKYNKRNEDEVAHEDVILSLTKTLDDVCNGMLPLGGSVMRGHGCFKGQWENITKTEEN